MLYNKVNMEKSGFTAKKIAATALLAALSLVMFIVENQFPPLFIPGAKMGLANIFSLAALILYGPVEAFAVVAVRTVLGSLFAGNISMLLYSLTGGVAAMAVSAVLVYIVYPRVSLMAVSIAAAVVHNIVQNLVYAAITETALMLAYMPYLALIGVLSGAIVGAVVLIIFKKVPYSAFARVAEDLRRKRDAERETAEAEISMKNGAAVPRRTGGKNLKAVKGRPFFSGAHVPDRKELAKGAPIEIMPPPAKVAINTAQSLGRPAVPCVQVGDSVKTGQVIARANGAVSSDVFASISGTVKEIAAMGTETGAEGQFIVIEADGEDTKEFMPPLTSPTAEEILARIKDAGLVGMGGAGFPTAVKLNPPCPVDTLIINGAECEPYLTCDYRLMKEHADEIARGARYIAKALGVSDIIIGIERNKPDCIEIFEGYDDIKVVALKKVYPMGGEKQLIYCATGRKVWAGKLPADVGVIVQNVATCFAACEAVEKGKPLYERVMTVSGKSVKQPKNLLVRVGTPIADIVAYCGGEESLPKKVVLGGPMTGIALKDLGVYTKKTTSAVLLLSEKEAAAEQPTPCLNCGLCADHCPMHLMPMNTAFYSSAGDYETAAKMGGTPYCIECGVCEYVCPAKRPLIQAIRKTKAELRKMSQGGNK